MSLFSARLQAAVGQSGPRRQFQVEAGIVRAFREAVAVQDGLDPVIAPSTFVVNANMRLGIRVDVQSLLDGETTTLNAGTVYRFNGPLRVGDRLEAECSIDCVTEKTGRSGALLFVETLYRYHQADGALFGSCRQTTVHRPRNATPAATAGSEGRAAAPEPKLDWFETDPVTTRQLVQWAGASGDFNPLHYDLEFARAAGFPRVVVTGSLKLAMIEALLHTRWPGQTITELSIRHVGSDLAGDRLRLGTGRPDAHGRVALAVVGSDHVSLTGDALLVAP